MQKSIITEYPDGSKVMSNIRRKKNIPVIGVNDTYSATKVDRWYDNSIMSPDKADGIIYMRSRDTNEYWMVNLPNFGELFLEKDSMQAMRDMSSTEILLLKMGYWKGVRLNGYYVKNDTPAPIEYYISDTVDLDDGGSVVVVGDIKLKHDFNDKLDVRYIGYFSGYEGESFLNKASSIAKNIFLEDFGNYKFNNNSSTNRPEVFIYGNYSTIEATDDYNTSLSTSGIFINISNVVGTGQVFNLKINLNNKSSEGIRFFNPQNQKTENVTSTVYTFGCEVYNGYKSATIGSGTNNASGITCRGSFMDIIHDNNYIHDIRSENIANTTSRGLLIYQDNNDFTWAKRALIRNCRIEEISKPIGGTIYDSDGIFMSSPYSTPYVLDETLNSELIIENCYFSNCYGRAVKSQVGTTRIEGCTSYSNKYNQQAVFDFQRNEGTARGNKVILNNTSSRIFECAMFDPFPQNFIIENNTVEIIGNNTERDIIFVSVGGQGGGSPYNTSFKNVKVNNNIVKGKIAYFINARVQSESYFNEMDCIGNTVNGVTAFIRTWTYGTSTNYGLVKVNCQNNKNNDPSNNKVWLEAQNSTLWFSNYLNNIGFEESFKPNELLVGSSTYSGTDYNVKCDGTADDVEIRTSINRFRGNKGTVRLTEGTFNIENVGTILLETPDKISFVGKGIGVTIVDFKTSASYGLSFLGASVGDMLKGITFKCDSAPKTTAGVRGVFNNCLVEDVEVYGSSTVGLFQSSQGSNSVFRNLKLRNNTSHGLHVMPNEAVFENIESSNNTGNGILSNASSNSKNVLFKNIKVNNNNNGINITGASSFIHVNYQVDNLRANGNITNDLVISDRISDGFVIDSNFIKVTNTSVGVKFFNRAKASADTAQKAAGANPTKEEFDALVDELRDLKAKLRDITCGLLTPNT